MPKFAFSAVDPLHDLRALTLAATGRNAIGDVALFFALDSRLSEPSLRNVTATAAALKKTPLHEEHVRLGARLVDFGGWSMPVQYSGIIEEHHAVRGGLGVFDISHMGQFFAEGPGAQAWLNELLTNNVTRLDLGECQYTFLLNETGGVIDDLIVYRIGDERYLLVVNAAKIDEDFGWMQSHLGPDVEFVNRSAEFAGIAVQGPRSAQLFDAFFSGRYSRPARNEILVLEIDGAPYFIARTGYTGEDGCEIFCASDDAPRLWDALLAAGEGVLRPIGLGARDTLRLEARLCLYGNDIDEEHTPHEAGLSWVVKGRGFVGEEALRKQLADGIARRLVGFIMRERGIARHGYPIVGEGGPMGVVTSGTTGPTLGAAIGLGYTPASAARVGGLITIDCRGKLARAEIVKGPFYKRPI